MVDPQDVQENLHAQPRQGRSKSLITWLVVSMVGMMVIYLLFNIVLTSS
ncbi:MAG: hypothetical protein IIC06_02280 [Proteobacteria bacterium]|nr:hypothetical protein [Pseudomonadota bacterium]